MRLSRTYITGSRRKRVSVRNWSEAGATEDPHTAAGLGESFIHWYLERRNNGSAPSMKVFST
jgi:hypothetical protein